jgi:hypothetical protein
VSGSAKEESNRGDRSCSVEESLERYEALRLQVLKPAAGTPNLEVAWIECQGLAAWIERGPGNPVPSGEPGVRLEKDTTSELVIVLADFIVGRANEVENGG